MLFCSKPQLFWTSSERWSIDRSSFVRSSFVDWVFQSLEVICVWQIVVGSDLCLTNRSWNWFVSDKWVFQSLSIVWLKFVWLRVTANKICAIVLLHLSSQSCKASCKSLTENRKDSTSQIITNKMSNTAYLHRPCASWWQFNAAKVTQVFTLNQSVLAINQLYHAPAVTS